MTPDRHARIRSVFLEVAALPPTARSDLLAKRCGTDAELKAEVEKLLSHYIQETQDLFGTAPTCVVENAPLCDEPSDSAVPTIQRNPQPRQNIGTEKSVESLPRHSCIPVFPAGQVIAERYRIVNLLGRGGMGSVYRADDLILHQSVALKFLDPRLAGRRDGEERLINEVRLARRVTHVNVCRVFDIGESDGGIFLSMEYVDGENLANLIGRVGRLTREKAIDVARQVCTGLAAVHGAGILHRDLKPANIMLDGQGRVRLTDFGIAVTTHERGGLPLRAGTPAYMSPEQFGGRRVDVRSDVYALGLVLYELFSGKPAFQAESVKTYAQLHERENPRPLADFVSDVDPKVDELVQACLAKDPSTRPPTALAVAAALPGVDALSVAMEANQTAEPALIANACAAAFRLTRPGRWAAAAIAFCVLLPVVRPAAQLPWERPHAKPPLVLAERAGELLALGDGAGTHSSATDGRGPSTSAYGYCDEDQVIQLMASAAPFLQMNRGALTTNNELFFWFRTSHEPLAPRFAETLVYQNGRTSLLDPPFASGQQVVILDQTGQLRALLDATMSAPHRSPDWPQPSVNGQLGPNWAVYFEMTGFPPAVGDPVIRDSWVPLGAERCGYWPARAPHEEATEAHACWSDDRVRLFLPLCSNMQSAVARSGPSMRPELAVAAFRFLLLTIALISLPLAWRNQFAGRADTGGAMKCGALVFGVYIVAWVVGARHAPSVTVELFQFAVAFARAMSAGALIVILYMGLEPLARRSWPHLFIGWARMLQFRRADALVWEHVLVGVTVGAFWALWTGSERALVNALGLSSNPSVMAMWAGDRLCGGGPAVAGYLYSIPKSLAEAMLLAALLAFIRLLVRRPLIAAVAVAMVLVPVLVPRGAHNVISLLFVGTGVIGLGIWMMSRVGLLAVAVAAAVAGLFNAAPLRLDSTAWYRGQSLLLLGLVVALALYAWRIAARPAPVRLRSSQKWN